MMLDNENLKNTLTFKKFFLKFFCDYYLSIYCKNPVSVKFVAMSLIEILVSYTLFIIVNEGKLSDVSSVIQFGSFDYSPSSKQT